MESNEKEQLVGTVDRVVYRNKENGYTVFELITDDGMVTVVGILPSVGEGQKITVSGNYSTHPRFGVQFKADSFETELPNNADDIARYLSSGLFEGIGPQTAARIASRFGADTFDIIENNPLKLCEIKGISPKKARAISEHYSKLLEIKPIILFFQSHGFSAQNAMDAFCILGGKAISIIKSNPYILMDDGIGISFKKCDALAYEMGIGPNDPIRIDAALRYILKHNLGNGHTFLPKEKLIATCTSAMQIETEDALNSLNRLIRSGTVSTDGDIGGIEAVYLAEYYYAECYLAERITKMASIKNSIKNISEIISKTEENYGFEFNDKQREAVNNCVNSKISVLNGGPGTGKTTTLLCVLDVLEKNHKEVLIAAPTGRAAKRIEELTGREAKTIHRMLELEMNEGKKYSFRKNEEDPLKGDYVIIDEASMADVLLMTALFKAMPEGMSVILVGDSDQLPPVSAGNFFGNIVASGCVTITTLTDIFRQAQNSGIIIGSHEINKGKVPNLDNNSCDFFFISRSSESDVCSTVADLCSRRLPQKYGFDPLSDIQVIAPTRVTRCGTEYLNAVLQTALNAENKENESIVYNNRIYAKGDKVMQTENNYDIFWTRELDDGGKGIYNGDIGVITAVNKIMKTVSVRFDDKNVIYNYEMLSELEPAYAITVHKSQGSEFKAVIIPVFDAPKMLLNRCLLYTAVTRAKELLIFVGKREIVAEMVANGRANISYCGLKYLLMRYKK